VHSNEAATLVPVSYLYKLVTQPQAKHRHP